jgi:hypothetical protein
VADTSPSFTLSYSHFKFNSREWDMLMSIFGSWAISQPPRRPIEKIGEEF